MNNQREKKRKVSCHGCACSYSYEPCHKDTNKIPIPKKISVPIQGSYQSPPPSPTNEPETMIPPPKSKQQNNDIQEHERMGWSSKILYKSVDDQYSDDKSKPNTGDLVLSTIGDIGHPALFCDHFSKSFLILGAVVGFKQMKGGWRKAWRNNVSFDTFASKEKVVVSWMMIHNKDVLYCQIPTPGVMNQNFKKN